MDNIYKNIIFRKPNYKKQLEYWLDKLSNKIRPLDFHYSSIKGDSNDDKHDEIKFIIPKDISNYLLKICGNNNIGLFVELVAIIKVLLYRYTNESSISIVTPVLGIGKEPKYNDRVLLFSEIDKNDTIKTLLGKERNDVLESYKNQYYPIEEYLVKLIDEKENIKNILNIGVELKEIHKHNVLNSNNTSILFSFERMEESISCIFKYNSRFIGKELANSMEKSFLNILRIISDDIDIKVKEIDLLSKDEQNHILYNLNLTDVKFNKDLTIVKMFENQVEKYPDKKAVIFNNTYLTYDELNKKANKLARYLVSNKIVRNNIIGILGNNSIDTIIFMLGIMKAGAAYLPMDISIPEDRFKYILKNSNMKKILVKDKSKVTYDIEVDFIDNNDITIWKCENTNLNISTNPSDLIYVIYTSGTTGTPKGVLIENKSLTNYILWFTKFGSINNHDKTVLVSSFAFDIGYTTIYSSLINGCELHLLEKDLYTHLKYLSQYIYDNRITYFKLTPSFFSVITQYEEKKLQQYCKYIKLIILGGESIIPLDIERFHKKYKNVNFINHYGPTETTIGCIAHKINFETFDKYKKNPILGKPIDNISVYILDKNLCPVPIGVKGEIYISGAGLAKGYLNNESLTAEKFIGNPYLENSIMYKTGDIGKYVDNNIQFCSRSDNQVKISGYRVEISGVEYVIRNYYGIKEAFVTLDDDNKLVAYLVGENINLSDLKNYIKKTLMQYMIPTHFFILDKMPFTLNGKIDKKALLKNSIDNKIEYVKPRNYIEKCIASAWEKILNIEHVGIYDDYFELGGDSIKAIQILSILQENNINVKVANIMEHTTIDELINYVSVDKKVQDQSLVLGEVPITPVQKRFFEYNFKDMNHWNQAVMIYKENGFDEKAIIAIFDKIMEHHDALRMSFNLSNLRIKQVNKDLYEKMYRFEVFDLKNINDYIEEIHKKSSYVQSQIDLKNGPLVKLALFKTNNGDYLLIAIHHLVVDGVAWRILLKDFSDGYIQYTNSETIKFLPKTTSFKEWATTLQKISKDNTWLDELKYWESLKKNRAWDLPNDYKNIKIGSNKESESLYLTFSEEETENILKNVNRAYSTEINHILLTALGYSMKEWTGKSNILINLEGHGREVINEDVNLSRTVGWFTSIFPVILDMSKCDDLSSEIRMVKEMLKNIPNKGIGYGILRYLTPIEMNKDVDFELNPRVCFNYLGHIDNNLDTNLFKLSNISYGDTLSLNSQRQYAIHINGIVREKKLVFDFNYDKSNFSESDMKNLVENYRQALLRITHHCMNTLGKILTPSDITKKNLSIKELDNIIKEYYHTIDNIEIEDIYDLTPMQDVIYEIAITKNDPAIYYQCRAFTINKKINLEKFQKCYNDIIANHVILRTAFVETASHGFLQIVYKNYSRDAIYKDISNLSNEEQAEYIINLEETDKSKGFKLSKADTMRLFVIKISDDKYKVIWSNHHIVLDGWSRMIVLKEFIDNFEDSSISKHSFKKNNANFRDYIIWINDQDKSKAKTYWSNLMDGYIKKPILEYIVDKDANVPMRREEFFFVIDVTKTASLNNLSKQKHVTLNAIFNAIWGVILQKKNKVEDIAFCAPAAGRVEYIKNVSNIVGLTMNNIPIRAKKGEEGTFIELAISIEKIFRESEEYSYFTLKSCGDEVYDSNIFESAFCYENYPIDNKIMDLYRENKVLTDFEMLDQARCNLVVYVLPFETINIKISYNCSILSENYIQDILESFNKIIDIIIDNININIDDILI